MILPLPIRCLKENLLPTYTKIKHYDLALDSSSNTLQYRKNLIQREIEKKNKLHLQLEEQLQKVYNQILNSECNHELRNNLMNELNIILNNSDNVRKSITIKKLNKLYNGQVFLKNEVNSFLNLSNYELTNDEKEFLNLGLNFHLQAKYNKLHKKTELECLYQNLLELESNKEIKIEQRMCDLLRAESTKHRNTYSPNKLPIKLINAAKSIKNNEQIIVRRADKSAIYVIMNKQEYIEKINLLLSDNTKFKKLKKDPTNTLKKKVNTYIKALNAAQNDIKIKQIIGDFKPGYIYGNVKIHKQNNPLRPIISQIPTPTYNLAKTINNIISPYIPCNYSLKSTSDFIDILKSKKCEGLIASLDVESLFSNVPINSTIEIILQHVYNNAITAPPKIPKEILKNMLELCTKEAPFLSPTGEIYRQIEGVAMGSPLGPTFANFYMGDLENKILPNLERPPTIYCRYVDDIFVQVNNIQDLEIIQNELKSNSVLNFTVELNENKKLPFLDIKVDATKDTFHTKIYKKETDAGVCLDGNSCCAEKYKISVINNYINRAFKVTNNWEDFHEEIKNIKQTLVNNNYSNNMIDSQIKTFLEKKVTQNEKTKENKTTINIYYCNQMHHNYKIDERVLKEIVHNNTSTINPNKKINLMIY